MTEQVTVPAPPTWLWYLEPTEGEGIALDASATLVKLSAELSQRFSEVHVLRNRMLELDKIRAYGEREGSRPPAYTLGNIRDAPWNEHTFDCIAVHDSLAALDLGTVETLGRIRVLLKVGGWFVGGSPNVSYLLHPRTSLTGLRPSVFARRLREARFREIRCIFVTPSLDNPLSMIPDAAAAGNAYESFDSIQGTTKWARRTLARLGFRSALYPAYFILGRR